MQLRALFAMFNERGMSDRDDRLDWTNQHLDRTVVSASELTDVEASRLLEQLAQVEAAQASDVVATPAAAAASEDEQQTLGDPLLTQDGAEIILSMRREAGVDDTWIRGKLAEFGIALEGPVSRSSLQRLTRVQADELHGALNDAIDASLSEG